MQPNEYSLCAHCGVIVYNRFSGSAAGGWWHYGWAQRQCGDPFQIDRPTTEAAPTEIMTFDEAVAVINAKREAELMESWKQALGYDEGDTVQISYEGTEGHVSGQPVTIARGTRGLVKSLDFDKERATLVLESSLEVVVSCDDLQPASEAA